MPILLRDLRYLPGLMDIIDCDSSEGKFGGYIDVNDFMQSTTGSCNDAHSSTPTRDEDISTQTIDINNIAAPIHYYCESR